MPTEKRALNEVIFKRLLFGLSAGLGHSSVKMTLDTYSHVLPDMEQSAADKLQTMLYRKSGTF